MIYTGQLYKGQRDPTMLFEAMRDLIKDGSIAASDVRIRFYGVIEPWLPVLVAEYGLKEVVELNGPTPRKDVMEYQRRSQILVLLPWADPRETGHHSAKLFEYLAAGRPILAVGGSHGVLTQSLEETHAACMPYRQRKCVNSCCGLIGSLRIAAASPIPETRKPSRSTAIPKWPADLRKCWTASRPRRC